MTKNYQLSLPMAVLINVNIMLGAGIFINTVVLAQRAGALGGLAYLAVGALLLPLVICMAQLLKIHPAGGFYAFAQQEISSFAGFISAWSYIIGKLASATLMIHSSLWLLQNLIPSLGGINIITLDGIVLAGFIALNLLNVKTGSAIQGGFMIVKSVPIIFAIIVGLFLLDGGNFTAPHLLWSGLPLSLPLVFYATMGFEAAISLSSKIKDPKKNAPRAIFISYGLVLLIVTIYQIAFYGALGDSLVNAADHHTAFPELLQALLPASQTAAKVIVSILHICFASSALGGAYGILFSNTWNVNILAKNNHLFGSKLFTSLNKHMIPYACVLLQGAICALYFAVTWGNQLPLQIWPLHLHSLAKRFY